MFFAAVHESVLGPFRPFAATPQYVRNGRQSRRAERALEATRLTLTDNRSLRFGLAERSVPEPAHALLGSPRLPQSGEQNFFDD
jgi:hypothetical protein